MSTIAACSAVSEPMRGPVVETLLRLHESQRAVIFRCSAHLDEVQLEPPGALGDADRPLCFTESA
jgi:hypothetical protein